MKIIKKIVKYFGILLLLVVIALITIPIVFKDSIVSKVKEIANESVHAKIDFGDFDLSLITSFPSFSFEINAIEVINKAPFEGDTLAHIGNMNFELDLMSVLNGRYIVNSFNISDVTANAKVLKDGTANWDIAFEDSTKTDQSEELSEEGISQETEEAGDFITGLKSFSINNVNVSYVDIPSQMVAIIKGFNQSGSFHLVNDSTEIDLNTSINSILFDLEGERLADNLKLESDVKIAADLNHMGFHFKENVFKLNNLKLGVNGDLAMPDDMNFNLTLSAKDNKFKDVLSLIPESYLSDLEGVETKGDFSLIAHLRGEMTDGNLPGFDVDFLINEAYLHYPDLPEAIEDINVHLVIDSKDGILDHTTIDLKEFNMQLAKNPIDLKFFATNIESDPNMKGEVHSKIKLENLVNIIPIDEGEVYQGGINANFKFGGKLSSIENENYEDFNAEGSIILDDFLYETKDLPKTVIKTGYLNFAPHYFEVSNFDMKIGESDLTINGRIENILPYVFHDSTIVGSFNINSIFFNLNEFLEEDSTIVDENEVTLALQKAEESVDSTYGEPTEVFEIPRNIEFVLNSSFKKIDFENMPIDDFKGQIQLKNGIAHFDEASMKVYQGKITIDGDYNTQDMAHPKTSLDLTVDNMKIREAYLAFNTVRKMVPIAKKANGEFHTEFKFETELDDTLAPIYSTMNGKGFLNTTNLEFAETEGWKKLMTTVGLKNKKFDKVRAEDIKVEYQFIDGRLYTSPFVLNLGNIKGEVSGYVTFDNYIDYKYALKIPREEIGSVANRGAELIEIFASKNGIDVSLGDYIFVDVLVTGTTDNPVYKIIPKGAATENNTKDQTRKIVAVKIEKAKEKVKVEVDKIKEKANEEATRLKKDAEDKINSENERLKKEAEDKAKAEADKAKAKVKDEAKKKVGGFLKKGFGN